MIVTSKTADFLQNQEPVKTPGSPILSGSPLFRSALLSGAFLISSALILVTFLSACTADSTGSRAAPSPAEARGTDSSGGGFVTENSKILLSQTSQELAEKIRKATPALFKNFPASWDQESFANLIANIRLSPMKDLAREGQDLMFNYATDANGPYIEALRPYFHIYGATAVKFESEEDLRAIRADLQLKILHEAGHHLGLQEEAAERFGQKTLIALERDFIHCKIITPLENHHGVFDADYLNLNLDHSVPTRLVAYYKMVVNGWFIHIPTGRNWELVTSHGEGLGESDALEDAIQEFLNVENPSKSLKTNLFGTLQSLIGEPAHNGSFDSIQKVAEFNVAPNSTPSILRFKIPLFMNYRNSAEKTPAVREDLLPELTITLGDQKKKSQVIASEMRTRIYKKVSEDSSNSHDEPTNEDVNYPVQCELHAQPIELN